MRKLLFVFCLFPLFAYASPNTDDHLVGTYQELCAKEQDPIKRQNYCRLLVQPSQKSMISERFRQDTALV